MDNLENRMCDFGCGQIALFEWYAIEKYGKDFVGLYDHGRVL